MSARIQVDKLLADCGATLKRNSKHEVWTLPNGQKFTRGKTPSDKKADANSLTDLKHALGIVKTTATIGARRAKKPVPRAVELKTKYDKPVNSDLADKLQLCGASEAALRDEITMLREEIALLGDRDEIMRQRVFAAEDWIKQCWFCKLRQWWRSKKERQ